MLYVTTREKFDAFTAPRTLSADCGPDGGVFVPFRMPVFTPEDIASLRQRSFGQNVAGILNLFFSCRLTGWDVDTCVGKNPVRISTVGNNIQCAQLWKNLDGSYQKLEKALAAKVCGEEAENVQLTSWLRIAIRIAVLFGVFGQLETSSSESVNVSVPADDFLLPMAVWYGRKMGLPIGKIICACHATGDIWELLHIGEMKTDGDAALCREVERLIFDTLGIGEAIRFAAIAERKGLYKLLPVEAEKVSAGMFSAVVSQERLGSVIPSVFRTNAYVLAEDSAVSYAALMDYRARTGSNRAALLLEDSSPEQSAGTL